MLQCPLTGGTTGGGPPVVLDSVEPGVNQLGARPEARTGGVRSPSSTSEGFMFTDCPFCSARVSTFVVTMRSSMRRSIQPK